MTNESYKIVAGDNLSSIAKKYGTTVDALVSLNKIADANKIYAGQIIKIPGVANVSTNNNDAVVAAALAKYQKSGIPAPSQPGTPGLKIEAPLTTAYPSSQHPNIPVSTTNPFSSSTPSLSQAPGFIDPRTDQDKYLGSIMDKSTGKIDTNLIKSPTQIAVDKMLETGKGEGSTDYRAVATDAVNSGEKKTAATDSSGAEATDSSGADDGIKLEDKPLQKDSIIETPAQKMAFYEDMHAYGILDPLAGDAQLNWQQLWLDNKEEFRNKTFTTDGKDMNAYRYVTTPAPAETPTGIDVDGLQLALNELIRRKNAGEVFGTIGGVTADQLITKTQAAISSVMPPSSGVNSFVQDALDGKVTATSTASPTIDYLNINSLKNLTKDQVLAIELGIKNKYGTFYNYANALRAENRELDDVEKWFVNEYKEEVGSADTEAVEKDVKDLENLFELSELTSLYSKKELNDLHLSILSRYKTYRNYAKVLKERIEKDPNYTIADVGRAIYNYYY